MTTAQKAEMLRIINRHKARVLCNLEEVNCPTAYTDTIRSGFDWLRSDLVGMIADVNKG